MPNSDVAAAPQKVSSWTRLVKFAHTVFALPFALVALTWGFAQQGEISWRVLGLMLLCMIFARNSAMAFNRLADWRYDAKNPRTQAREIPAGVLSPRNVRWFVVANSALFMLCAGLINFLTLVLSPVALAVLLGYSLSKRFTWMCHLWLGVALGLAPVGSYIAATGHFSWFSVLMGFAVMFWVAGFDIIYALQDASFDQQEDLQSIPAKLGRKRAIRLSRIFSTISVLTMCASIITMWQASIWFAIAVALFATIICYQHLSVNTHDSRSIGRVMMGLNGFNSVLFALFMMIGILPMF